MALRGARCPVNKRGLENGRGIILLENAEAVRDRAPMPVAIDARQRRENVVGGVGDERRVMVGAKSALLANEVDQVRHLLKIRRNIWIVAPEMHVIEGDVNNPFDVAAGGVEFARCRRIYWLCCCQLIAGSESASNQ